MMNKNYNVPTLIAATMMLFGHQAYAGDKHGANALEHAAVAASHAEKGHLEYILEHGKEALHHAKIASEQHHDKHMHMEKAIVKLNEAIEHANKKHEDLASKAARKALEHIHKTFD